MDRWNPENPAGTGRQGPGAPPPHPGARPPHPGGPGPGPPDEPPRSRLAIAALVAWLVPPVGLVVGVLAIRRTGPRRKRGRNMAIAGTAVSVLWALVIAVGIVADEADILGHDLERDGAGRIAEAGELDVRRLRSGDCLQDPRSFEDIETVRAVPCDQPHDTQVIDTVRIRGDGDDFPGDAAVTRQADRCRAPVDAALGRLRDGLPPVAQPYTLQPSEDLWSIYDERDIACMLIFERRFRGVVP